MVWFPYRVPQWKELIDISSCNIFSNFVHKTKVLWCKIFCLSVPEVLGFGASQILGFWIRKPAQPLKHFHDPGKETLCPRHAPHLPDPSWGPACLPACLSTFASSGGRVHVDVAISAWCSHWVTLDGVSTLWRGPLRWVTSRPAHAVIRR